MGANMNNETIIKELKQEIFKINACLTGISKNYYTIAAKLYNIKSKFYIEQTQYKGYKNISDLAENEFGFDKTKTYNLIAIHEKFFLNRPNSPYDIYKISQLIEMLSMSDEQISKCNPDMKVMELREFKNDFSRIREKESIENTELLEKNNVIEGVFPDKKDEPEEQKTTTIIVTELPKPEPKENKTITIDVKTENEQNNSFVQKDLYQDLYEKEHDKNVQLQLENVGLKNRVRLLEEKSKDKEMIINYLDNNLKSFYSKFKDTDFDVKPIKKLIDEITNFIVGSKLPEKLNFFKNVV